MPMIKTQEGYQLGNMLASGFSPRECQVLLMRAQGLSVKAIANAYNCSLNNIKSALSNMFLKTGAHNSTELITKAMQSGKLRFLSLLIALFFGLIPPTDHQYFARNTRPARTHQLRQMRRRDGVFV